MSRDTAGPETPSPSSDPVRITVAICTYNRCGLFRSTLQSLAGLEAPEELTWELLVVDNASTDKTPEVVEAFEGRLPLRSVREPRQGLSHARNRAVREMRGDYIIWTDDDVQVDPGWLSAYAQAFRDHPETAFFGGPILPWFEGEPPRWLRDGFDMLAGAYSVKYPDEAWTVLSEPRQLPFGANVAFPAEVQNQHEYDPDLGRKGESLMSGEETELLLDLLDRGETGRWVPRARLRHFIPEERQTLEYVRRLFRDHGKSDVLRDGAGDATTLFGRPRWAWRAAVEGEIRYRVARLFSDPEDWLPLLRDAAYGQGVLSAGSIDVE